LKSSRTVFDAVYRAAMTGGRVSGWLDHAKWRQALTTAHRFILDDDMSSFLADLSLQAFRRAKEKGSRALFWRLVDNLRLTARLPHPTTWIEWNYRLAERGPVSGRKLLKGAKVRREGLLLQQHPSLPNAIRSHLILFYEDEHFLQFPLCYGWLTDDGIGFPWRTHRPRGVDVQRPQVDCYLPINFVVSDLIAPWPDDLEMIQPYWPGHIRRAWSLLATIDDLPITKTIIRPARGFMAKGVYHSYLHRQTITIDVPRKEYVKVARDQLAKAHRRAHSVRGHWRRDWRNPLSLACEHVFVASEKHMTCSICKGRKIWVDAHQRGDSGKGLVLHDYKVTHDANL
jgi:hypothetical protein